MSHSSQGTAWGSGFSRGLSVSAFLPLPVGRELMWIFPLKCGRWSQYSREEPSACSQESARHPLSSGECHPHDSSLGQCYCLSLNRWKALKFRKITWLTREFMVQASVHLDQNSVLSLYIFQNKTFVWNTVCACVSVTQLCLTLCDPMDCSPLGSSVHGILQERILEWVTILFSRGSS